MLLMCFSMPELLQYFSILNRNKILLSHEFILMWYIDVAVCCPVMITVNHTLAR